MTLFQALRVYIQHLILSKPKPSERAVHDANGGAWSMTRFINLEARQALEHPAETRAIRPACGP